LACWSKPDADEVRDLLAAKDDDFEDIVQENVAAWNRQCDARATGPLVSGEPHCGGDVAACIARPARENKRRD
jgi:hypothetical protein